MRRLVHLGWIVLLLLAGPADAATLAETGPGIARLRGPIAPGDDARFTAFLAQPRAQPLRVLYLDSQGGHIDTAVAIARQVRRAGLVTAVEADSRPCDSACTLIFAAGVRRHNVAGDTVFEGHTGFTGLGFHPAHRRRAGSIVLGSAEATTEAMRAFYAEMGAPRAAELLQGVAYNSLYRPSGRRSLEVGIATSLAAP